ncbi:MAG: tRNA uridine-5-carboxymethylaminomethyl(34) synthesis GTPase MnmE, partial [Spirochaetales bacterium]|nr:tRNA uridine-5-carboxymethylaminomethyl(34) synthesis GTPase MnmE [Spirochaetales bacterium]MCF7938837.1 tRNA uridine-5-carboxymethylaminomethyl(34) synthesis GTPase MnmE [Spirochaetales bacterium]
MMDRSYDTSDDIAALATPLSESALAIIRTSGAGCLERLDRLFRPSGGEGTPLSQTAGHRLRVGELIDPDQGGVLDQVVAAVYRKPAGYCGEDGVELFCHGNPPALKVVLEVLEKAGFRGAERGEFTYRAFLNGKMDLTRAEAVNEIVTAKTFTAQQLALDRLCGAVQRRILEARRQLILASAAVELWLDYPEDEFEEDRAADPRHAIEAAAGVLSELSNSYRVGRIYQEGVSVVLAGPTNAGKSALFNHLVKQERSIVSPHHGTTRDYIEATVNLGGIPVRLVDTAGIRDTEHPVEAEGIRRSRRELEEAALVIYLIDAAEGLSEADLRVLEAEHERIIPLWNKVDLAAGTPPEGFLS